MAPFPLSVSTSIDREEWLEKASFLSEKATKGKSHPFIENAPFLHVKHEATQFIKSAEAHLICSSWSEAAIGFKRVGHINGIQLKNPQEATSFFLKAARASKKCRSNADVYASLSLAQSECCESESYGLAGCIEEDVAQMKRKEGDLNSAIKSYQSASNFFLAEGQPKKALTCAEVAASIMGSSLNDRCEEAALLYEDLGHTSNELKVKKHDPEVRASTDYFFRMGLLLLSDDKHDLLKEKLCELRKCDREFRSSCELAFLENVLKAIATLDMSSSSVSSSSSSAAGVGVGRDGTIDFFADLLYGYEKVHCALDPWSLKLLDDIHKDMKRRSKNPDQINL